VCQRRFFHLSDCSKVVIVSSRLVQNIRLADDSSTVGVLGKEWDLSIEEQEVEFRDDLRAASGIGKRRQKVQLCLYQTPRLLNQLLSQHQGRRPGVVLSQQVKVLIGVGNQAYIDGEIQESIQTMQEVIRIEPRATSAWSVLANCYHDLGQPQKALQLRIMGAHLHHDAEEWERLAKESKCVWALPRKRPPLTCGPQGNGFQPTGVVLLWESS
jgi:general transcription factor 3C polypeptide 3 (transcription factor C subunit 4)